MDSNVSCGAGEGGGGGKWQNKVAINNGLQQYKRQIVQEQLAEDYEC